MKGQNLEKAISIFKQVQELQLDIDILKEEAEALVDGNHKVKLDLTFDFDKPAKKVAQSHMDQDDPSTSELRQFLNSMGGAGSGGSPFSPYMLFGTPAKKAEPDDKYSMVLDEVEALYMIQTLMAIKRSRMDKLKAQLIELGVKQ